MKLLPFIFVTLFLIQSCHTKHEQNKMEELSLKNCDELNIVYYSNDTFVFKTLDTSTIKNFVELITYDNENGIDSCETTEQLIFKNKGRQTFAAEVSIKNIKDTISCNNVTYSFGSKMYRHRLTYRAGMGIDEIYWHKVNPEGNPWPGVDSSKFHYEEIKNNR